VLPNVASATEEFLADESLDWQSAATPLLDHRIQPYKPLITRIDPASVSKMVDASRASLAKDDQPARANATDAMIDLDDFLKSDLRVATITSAETIAGADKLLRITVDLGDETRSVLSGIRNAYSADELVGRKVILVANLKPYKTRFGISDGMLLAAGSDDGGIYLVSPDRGASPGLKVR